MYLQYLSIFIGCGFLGWFLDTAFRSWEDRRYSTDTLIPFFSFAYAIAATVLYTLFYFWQASFAAHVAVGALLSVVMEYLGGRFALTVFKRRLWDYRQNRWNFQGLVDVEHSLYCLGLTAIYRFIFGLL
jgi:uncharacterized membrane protein